MISETQKEKLTERLVNRTDKVNELLLKELGKIIKNIRENKTYNYLDSYYKVINKINRITSQNIKDIYKILNAVAKDIKNDSRMFYEYRNMEFVPYEEDAKSKSFVNEVIQETSRAYSNNMAIALLGTATLVNNRIKYNNIQQTYEKVINEAEMNINLDEEEYYIRMQELEKQIGKSGIKTIDYKQKRSLAIGTLTTLAVMNSIRTTNNQLNEIYGEEFGANGLEIIPHSHPAPDHAEYQGKQFTFEEFDDLQGSLARPIGEYNCYHDVRRIIKGISKPLYNKKELKKILDNNQKGFDLDGKHYTLYEGTQLQRNIERAVKEEKNIQILAKASGDKELVRQAQSKITQLNNKYKEIIEKGNLESKKYRMTVSGYKRINVNKM